MAKKKQAAEQTEAPRVVKGARMKALGDRVSMQRKEQLLEYALAKLRVVLSRSPSVSSCVAIISEYYAETSKDPMVWLDGATIDDMGFEDYQLKLLHKAGFVDMRSLTKASFEELQSQHGIRFEDARRIEAHLWRFGLKLADPPVHELLKYPDPTVEYEDPLDSIVDTIVEDT